MIPLVVFASGRGTNFDAIQKAISNKKLQAKIQAVVSDQPQALILEKAKAAGIPTFVIPFPSSSIGTLEDRRIAHEKLILREISPFQPRFLVLAGYMRIITHDLIEAFRSEKGYSRIVNIHPSLLPSFPGIRSYSQAFHYGVQVAGVTIHLVEPAVDRGPICAQEAFSIADCRSEKEVEQRGLEVEHRLFPQTLSWILPERFSVEVRERRLCVRQN